MHEYIAASQISTITFRIHAYSHNCTIMASHREMNTAVVQTSFQACHYQLSATPHAPDMRTFHQGSDYATYPSLSFRLSLEYRKLPPAWKHCLRVAEKHKVIIKLFIHPPRCQFVTSVLSRYAWASGRLLATMRHWADLDTRSQAPGHSDIKNDGGPLVPYVLSLLKDGPIDSICL